MDAFRILMIARASDDGQSVQRAGLPFAQEELAVIFLSPLHPVADLHHYLGVRNPCCERIIVCTGETAVDVSQNQDGSGIGDWRLVIGNWTLEGGIDSGSCPMGFRRRNEPSLPAEGAYDCAYH